MIIPTFSTDETELIFEILSQFQEQGLNQSLSSMISSTNIYHKLIANDTTPSKKRKFISVLKKIFNTEKEQNELFIKIIDYFKNQLDIKEFTYKVLTKEKNINLTTQIIGHHHFLKNTENRILNYFQANETEKNNMTNQNTILYGRAGCGKTEIIKTVIHNIAREEEIYFFEIRAKDFDKGEHVNDLEDLIKDLIKKNKKVIIFIDEMDGVLINRTILFNNNTKHDITNQMLQFINNMENKNCIIFGATNFISNLDHALIRSGRFKYQHEIFLPNTDERYTVIKSIFDSNPSLLKTELFIDIPYQKLGIENYGKIKKTYGLESLMDAIAAAIAFFSMGHTLDTVTQIAKEFLVEEQQVQKRVNTLLTQWFNEFLKKNKCDTKALIEFVLTTNVEEILTLSKKTEKEQFPDDINDDHNLLNEYHEIYLKNDALGLPGLKIPNATIIPESDLTKIHNTLKNLVDSLNTKSLEKKSESI